MSVSRERGHQMPWRGNRCGAQAAACAVARDDKCVEAFLQMQIRCHTQTRDKFDEPIAAAQEDVLAVVDLMTADFKGGRAPAEQPAALEKLYLKARVGEVNASGQPGQAGADDGYATLSHDSSTTRSFSMRESEARARNGNSGSAPIFSRMR